MTPKSKSLRRILTGALFAVMAGLLTWALFPGAIEHAMAWLNLKHAATGTALATAPAAAPAELAEQIRSTITEVRATQQNILTDQKSATEKLKTLEEELKTTKGLLDETTKHLATLRKSHLERRSTVRPKGKISDEAAEQLAARFLLHAEKSGKTSDIIPDGILRAKLLGDAKRLLGVEHLDQKALSTAEIPLPTHYYGEIMELIAEYGVVAQAMTSWPLSGGVDKPPRSKTGFEFGSIAMSAQFTEKNAEIEFASLESHKIGGIIYTPREIREQSIVALGQYLAKMAAVRFAWAEDKWGFLADGSNTYESVKGVCKICSDNALVKTLGAGKTAPSDAIYTDFRALLGLVNSRARGNGVWYLNNTWEAVLPDFNSEKNQYIFRYTQSGTPLLFGRPIIWTEVLTPYGEAASASSYLTVFGDLSWYWFGKRPNGPRIDESEHLKFDYDQIATRFIEEIDFDYMAVQCAATLKTAAA